MVDGQLFKIMNKQILKIGNWINGQEVFIPQEDWIEKYNPHNGKLLSIFCNSTHEAVDNAVKLALRSFSSWSSLNPIKRGQFLGAIVAQMKNNLSELTETVALETGKSISDASGEVQGAILQGEYFAGEGMRLFGQSLNSGMDGKTSHTVREPHGVAALIVPANTPIANIAWKVFPALICGNTVILKSSEDAPNTANLFAKLTKKAGLPDGILNVIHGKGEISGAALVANPQINVISFTGSTHVGQLIAIEAASRLARVSLELGGKNPFIVCDDADIERAVHWASLSAFSNAGQRCASGSRIIVFENIYEEFKELFIAKAKSLKLGVHEGSDLGPVLNKAQQEKIIEIINQAKLTETLLCGGGIPETKELKNGFYIEPTIFECADSNSLINNIEIFGPVTSISKADNLSQAIEIANKTDYGLTAAIHTKNIDRGLWFAKKVKAGLVNINFGTYGSEPHMPFGGFGLSGNGTREPGLEALDVYSELKNISILNRPDLI